MWLCLYVCQSILGSNVEKTTIWYNKQFEGCVTKFITERGVMGRCGQGTRLFAHCFPNKELHMQRFLSCSYIKWWKVLFLTTSLSKKLFLPNISIRHSNPPQDVKRASSRNIGRGRISYQMKLSRREPFVIQRWWSTVSPCHHQFIRWKCTIADTACTAWIKICDFSSRGIDLEL